MLVKVICLLWLTTCGVSAVWPFSSSNKATDTDQDTPSAGVQHSQDSPAPSSPQPAGLLGKLLRSPTANTAKDNKKTSSDLTNEININSDVVDPKGKLDASSKKSLSKSKSESDSTKTFTVSPSFIERTYSSFAKSSSKELKNKKESTNKNQDSNIIVAVEPKSDGKSSKPTTIEVSPSFYEKMYKKLLKSQAEEVETPKSDKDKVKISEAVSSQIGLENKKEVTEQPKSQSESDSVKTFTVSPSFLERAYKSFAKKSAKETENNKESTNKNLDSTNIVEGDLGSDGKPGKSTTIKVSPSFYEKFYKKLIKSPVEEVETPDSEKNKDKASESKDNTPSTANIDNPKPTIDKSKPITPGMLKKILSYADKKTPERSPSSDKNDDEKSKTKQMVVESLDKGIDKTVNKLQDKLDHMETPDHSLEELLEKVKDVQRQRKNIKMMVFAYTAAQLALTASSYVKFTGPMFWTVVKVLDYTLKEVISPLDRRYYKHQVAYADVVSELLGKHETYKERIQKMPKKLVLKSKDGNEIILKVIRKEDLKDDDKVHLSNLGTIRLMSTALNL